MCLKLLAVSGGIDSMVLMDFLMKNCANEEFLVVTVDHGTRPSAALDAEFVARVAREKYTANCRVLRLGLGEDVSEELARTERYAAMETVGREETGGGVLGEDFEIWTAQHLDDLAESIAINLLRGTGWRGLAAMGRTGVRRPFLEAELFPSPVDKKWILRYAAEHGVSWREDPTNQSDNYLRNRIRPALRAMPMANKMRLYTLWQRQNELRAAIDESVVIFTTLVELPRGMFLGLDEMVADEILRGWLLYHDIATTRLQRADFLEAIRKYKAGKLFNLPQDRMAKVGTKTVRLLG